VGNYLTYFFCIVLIIKKNSTSVEKETAGAQDVQQKELASSKRKIYYGCGGIYKCWTIVKYYF
jgi:hypothetical protein